MTSWEGEGHRIKEMNKGMGVRGWVVGFSIEKLEEELDDYQREECGTTRHGKH